jgi:hypothetical protein
MCGWWVQEALSEGLASDLHIPAATARVLLHRRASEPTSDDGSGGLSPPALRDAQLAEISPRGTRGAASSPPAYVSFTVRREQLEALLGGQGGFLQDVQQTVQAALTDSLRRPPAAAVEANTTRLLMITMVVAMVVMAVGCLSTKWCWLGAARCCRVCAPPSRRL